VLQPHAGRPLRRWQDLHSGGALRRRHRQGLQGLLQEHGRDPDHPEAEGDRGQRGEGVQEPARRAADRDRRLDEHRREQGGGQLALRLRQQRLRVDLVHHHHQQVPSAMGTVARRRGPGDGPVGQVALQVRVDSTIGQELQDAEQENHF